MSEHVTLEPHHASPVQADEPVARGRRKWSTADRVRAFVLTAIFVLLTASVFAQHTEPVFGVAVATAWTAVFAIVWELAARALARARS
jgi:hypothetical protein